MINSENLDQVVDAIPDGILVLDSFGIAKYANKSAIFLFGGDSDFILERELGLPVDEEATVDLDIISNPQFPKIAEMRIQKMHLNGEDAYVASLRDVTLKRQEQEIIESVYNAFGLMNEGFFICNEDGKIFFANEALERITGYPRSYIVGRNPNFLQSGIHTDEFFSNFYKKLKEDGEWQGVIWNKRASGEIYPDNMTVTTLLKDGKIDKYIAVYSDFSEGYKYYKELNKLRRAAIDSNIKKNLFLTDASQAVREPISEIIGSTEFVADLPLTPVQKEYIDVIRSSSKSLLNIVNDILEVSKIDSGMNYTHNSLFSVKDLIQNVFQFFRVHSLNKELIFEFYLSENLPQLVKGDKESLRQILTNILANAFKFTSQGRIRFGVDSVEDLEDMLVLNFSVIDTGIGIAKENLDRIFDPFFKVQDELSNHNKSDKATSGLGLTIVSNLLEQNGGKIVVDSNYKKGSQFQFSYKVIKVNENQETSQFQDLINNKLEKWKSTNRTIHVLIVEDNISNLYYTKRVLEKKGISTNLSKSGKEALEKLEKQDYDLIIMDIKMPDVDGYTVTKQIRSHINSKKKNIPIIALTGLTSDESKTKCKEVGMNSVLHKPVAEDHLLFEILRFVFP